MKQMLKRQMKDIPAAEQEKMFNIIEKNPDFFGSIAMKVQEKMKTGKDQFTATMEVMKEHEAELRTIIK